MWSFNDLFFLGRPAQSKTIGTAYDVFSGQSKRERKREQFSIRHVHRHEFRSFLFPNASDWDNKTKYKVTATSQHQRKQVKISFIIIFAMKYRDTRKHKLIFVDMPSESLCPSPLDKCIFHPTRPLAVPSQLPLHCIFLNRPRIASHSLRPHLFRVRLRISLCLSVCLSFICG